MKQFGRFFVLMLVAAVLMTAYGCGPCGPSEPEAPVAPVPPPTKTNPTPTPPVSTTPMAPKLDDVVIALETGAVYFAYDRYDLDAAAQRVLREKAQLLKDNPSVSLKIEGHCDERGTEEYNLALGERRAKASYDYLVMQGVPASQLSMISYGKLYPAMEGSNERAWSLNRRDEFRAVVN